MPKAAKERRKNSRALRSNPYAPAKKESNDMDVEEVDETNYGKVSIACVVRARANVLTVVFVRGSRQRG